jgi:uncharacterized membrane protein HdeD (DUF308 family)
METTVVQSLLPHLWKSTLVSGILALGLGVLVLVWPGISVFVAAIVFGAYLLITGFTQVVFAFSLRVPVGGRMLLFIGGAAALILAVLCFLSLAESILLLAIWIGIGFIIRGVATTISAIRDVTLPARLWHVFIGAVSLLAGIVLIASPFESLEILALIVGIWLVVVGVFEIGSSFGIRSAFKALDEDASDAAEEDAAEEDAAEEPQPAKS